MYPTISAWRKYKARRRDSTREEIREALQGWKNDPWAERFRNNAFEILLRNRSQVEKFSLLHREPPISDSRRTIGTDDVRRKQIAALD